MLNILVWSEEYESLFVKDVYEFVIQEGLWKLLVLLRISVSEQK